MAIVEIFNFGKLPSNPGAPPGILGRSPGIEQTLADEIIRLCKGWGQPLLAEDSRPALLSFPLKTKPKFASKGAFVVIKVHCNAELLFQAAVIGRSDFEIFGYNPFAFEEAGAFPPWDPAAVVGRRTLNRPTGPLTITPAPSPEDVGMVDEALHQLLASHKLYLPIESPTAESDRCLALLVEVMPEALKQQLRFASFAPSPANGYHLAATATAGCQYSGWKRLMMTLVGGALPENLTRYVKKVRDCLAFGDLLVIKEQSKRLSLGMQKEEVKRPPEPKAATPAAPPVVAAIAKTKISRSPRTASEPTARRSEPNSTLAQLRGRHRQLPGVVIGLLVLAVSLGVGWTYLEFFHGGGAVQWSELVSWPGQAAESGANRVASLLEVPNVGAVYNRQIKKIRRAGMIPGLNQETDQRRAVVNLKKEAAIPLLEQVDLFLVLSGAGIRQGSRPDREKERLQALARQGHVLKVELARLELAWHSLSSGVNWQDLNQLSDPMVAARRDSLQKGQPSALKAAAADMNFESRLKKLGFATKQVGGMSQLLVLFQASQWSEQWNLDLYRAAKMVSPSASAITRAYRNSAFSLIRLKNAEHLDSFISGAFVHELKPGVWPGERVADILPGLRREIGKFKSNEAPHILAGTLRWYQTLENPLPMVDGLVSGKNSFDELAENPAVLFDPEVYGNYLERLRYQAGLIRPDNFVADKHFKQRWARHENILVQQKLLSDLSRFDDHFDSVRQQVEKLRSLATEGRDWTTVWADLAPVLDLGLAEGAALAGQDPTVAKRVLELQDLKVHLRQQRPLKLNQVTVRLDQEYLTGPEKVVFEFQTSPDGEIHRSEPFKIGPAAPAGSGWVGAVALSAVVQLSPQQPFRGMVRLVDDGRQLVAVEYPSLVDGVGPGALARPRPGRGGNLLIKIDDSWWRDIRFPLKKDPYLAF